MKRHDKASFCVYDEGFRKEGDWALNIKSVIVFGHIEFIDDVETIYGISAELSRKFTKDEDYISREIARSGPRTLLFALVPFVPGWLDRLNPETEKATRRTCVRSV